MKHWRYHIAQLTANTHGQYNWYALGSKMKLKYGLILGSIKVIIILVLCYAIRQSMLEEDLNFAEKHFWKLWAMKLVLLVLV